jgi:TolA-binding protein
MNTPDNLVPRVANLESLMQYMAETQRQLASNIGVLTTVLQKQDEVLQRQEERIKQNEDEIAVMRQMLKNYDETIVVMQEQIGLLLNKLLGNS